MGCGKTGQPTTRRVRTTVTAEQFEPVTDWMPATGLTDVKMVLKRKSVQLGGTAPTDGQVQVSYLSCASIVGTMTQELQAFNTTTDSYVAVTGWIPAIDVSKVNAAFVIAGLSGNFQCQLAVRTAATSIQAPSTWSKLEGASYRTSNEETSARRGERPSASVELRWRREARRRYIIA